MTTSASHKIAVSTATIAVAGAATGTGGLAAVFYCDSGRLELNGNRAGTSSDDTGESLLVESSGDHIGFKLVVKNASGTTLETVSFNFSRTSGNYIRKKFSTNPTLVNSSITKSDYSKTYWLGESFTRFANDIITTKTATNVYGVLLPLHKNDQAALSGNWGYRRESAQAAESGWVISQDFGTSSDYAETSANKLFRVACLHEGERFKKKL